MAYLAHCQKQREPVITAAQKMHQPGIEPAHINREEDDVPYH
jgi:hypothetical protein